MNGKQIWTLEKPVMPYFKVSQSAETEETTENLSQNRWYLSQCSNQVPPEYNSKALLLHSTAQCCYVKNLFYVVMFAELHGI